MSNRQNDNALNLSKDNKKLVLNTIKEDILTISSELIKLDQLIQNLVDYGCEVDKTQFIYLMNTSHQWIGDYQKKFNVGIRSSDRLASWGLYTQFSRSNLEFASKQLAKQNDLTKTPMKTELEVKSKIVDVTNDNGICSNWTHIHKS